MTRVKNAFVSTCLAAGVSLLIGCDEGADEDLDWEAFREHAEVVENGRLLYRVEWDYQFSTVDALRDYYDEYVSAEGRSEFRSRAHIHDGVRDVWPREKVRDLSYCVTSFFDLDDAYDQAVAEAAEAARHWSSLADVGFTHLQEVDDACDPLEGFDPPVDFVIRRKATGAACSTFPNDLSGCDAGGLHRWIQLDVVGANVPEDWTSLMVFKHEMGHMLGLRHEQAALAGESLSEALTAHDFSSVMNYPGIAGADEGPLDITATDGQGLRILYGMPVSMLASVVL